MTEHHARRRGPSRRAVLAGGASAALAAPFYARHARAQSGPIRIGFPVPLSGPYGSEAQEQVNCARIAIQQFNEAGGFDGRTAELLVRDDKLDPGEAATRTLELIESDEVHMLCGSLSASVQLAVNQIAGERGVIYNSISQSDTINEASDFTRFTFHEGMNPHMTAGAVGRHVFPRFGSRVAFLTADYAYGHEMVAGFQAAGEEFDVETVANITHPIGQSDFSTFFPRIQAQSPDILILCNFGRDQLNAVKQITDFGLKQQMAIATPAILFNQRIAAGPGPYDGVVGGANYYWQLEDEFETSRRLNEAYRETNDRPPSDYAAYGYAGIYGLLEGVKAAGSLEADAVIGALEGMEYRSYKGRQRFRECDHQSVQSVYVLEAKPKSEVEGEWDFFSIVAQQEADPRFLKTCEALGHA